MTRRAPLSGTIWAIDGTVMYGPGPDMESLVIDNRAGWIYVDTGTLYCDERRPLRLSRLRSPLRLATPPGTKDSQLLTPHPQLR